MRFEIIGPITEIETIAAGSGLPIRAHLVRTFGRGYWRKLKGIAMVRLRNGRVRRVELHWYEAHGIGRRDINIRRYIDEP